MKKDFREEKKNDNRFRIQKIDCTCRMFMHENFRFVFQREFYFQFVVWNEENRIDKMFLFDRLSFYQKDSSVLRCFMWCGGNK